MVELQPQPVSAYAKLNKIDFVIAAWADNRFLLLKSFSKSDRLLGKVSLAVLRLSLGKNAGWDLAEDLRGPA